MEKNATLKREKNHMDVVLMVQQRENVFQIGINPSKIIDRLDNRIYHVLVHPSQPEGKAYVY